MKKTLIIIGLIIIFLSGCSQEQEEASNQQEENANSQQEEKSVNSNEYEGNLGNYELLEVQVKEPYSLSYLQEDSMKNRINFIVKYTNTTHEAQQPVNAFQKELIVEHETDIELNHIFFRNDFLNNDDVERTETEKELISMRSLNIKPGATVNFLVEIYAEEELWDSLYLRDINNHGLNGDKYEVHLNVTE